MKNITFIAYYENCPVGVKLSSFTWPQAGDDALKLQFKKPFLGKLLKIEIDS